MSYHDFITLVAWVVGGTGGLGALFVWFKWPTEKGSIIVKSAEGVVVMQATFIKSLKEQNDKLEKHIEKQDLELERLGQEIQKLRVELDACCLLLSKHGLHLSELDTTNELRTS